MSGILKRAETQRDYALLQPAPPPGPGIEPSDRVLEARAHALHAAVAEGGALYEFPRDMDGVHRTKAWVLLRAEQFEEWLLREVKAP